MVSNIDIGSVEILNLDDFERALGSDQPSILLHGLAHAIYHTSSANEQFEVNSAYDTAMRTGNYDSVFNFYSELGPAYAKKDAPTYFAECTEAFLSLGFKMTPFDYRKLVKQSI